MNRLFVPLLALLLACNGANEPAPSDTKPDAGEQSPDAGDQTPDAGDETPDAGEETPDAGETPDGGEEESNCDICGETLCADSLNACNSDPRCREFADCVYKECEEGDNACIGDCFVEHETGSELFMAAADCLEDQCAVECDL